MGSSYSFNILYDFRYPKNGAVGLAFGVLERRLYVSDAGNSNVQSIEYPAGNSVNTISGIVVGGVALSPPAPK